MTIRTQASAHGTVVVRQRGPGDRPLGPPNSWLQASTHINYRLLVLTGKAVRDYKEAKIHSKCVFV